MSNESKPANFLKRTAFPSITGLLANAPMFPKPEQFKKKGGGGGGSLRKEKIEKEGGGERTKNSCAIGNNTNKMTTTGVFKGHVRITGNSKTRLGNPRAVSDGEVFDGADLLAGLNAELAIDAEGEVDERPAGADGLFLVLHLLVEQVVLDENLLEALDALQHGVAELAGQGGGGGMPVVDQLEEWLVGDRPEGDLRLGEGEEAAGGASEEAALAQEG